MKTSCLSSECSRSELHTSHTEECAWVCVGEGAAGSRWKINQVIPDLYSVSVGRATASCGCGIASQDMHLGTGLTEVSLLMFITSEMWNFLSAHHKEQEFHHIGSQVNLSPRGLCFGFILLGCNAATLSFTHAFRKYCQDQRRVTVTHYSVITHLLSKLWPL